MKHFNKNSLITVVAVFVTIALAGPITALAATSPTLTGADSYSVLGSSTVTCTGATTITGDVGVSPGTAITGFPSPCTVTPPSATHSNDASAIAAQADNLSAFGALDQACDQTFGAVDLTAQFPAGVGPGVYCSTSAFSLSGNLNLVGSGVWIFKTVSGLNTSPGSSVTGGDACDVWWRVGSSAVLDTTTAFKGNILALTDINLLNGASLNGRAMVQTGQVTLDNNVISGPGCTEPPPVVVASGGSKPQPVAVKLPLINVTKTPAPLNLPSGPGSVNYTYEVTNVGEIAMRVEVKDNKCSPVVYTSGDTDKDLLLDISETWIYNCIKTVTKTETNTVTASGYTDNGTVYDTANATVVVGVPIVPPLIHLLKKPNTFLLSAGGGPVTYMYTVTNPGTEPLNNVTVIDDKCTGLPGRVVGHPGDLNKNNLLEKNESWSFTCQTNLAATTTNTGTAEGFAHGLSAIDFSPATVVVASPSFPNTALPDASGFGQKVKMIATNLVEGSRGEDVTALQQFLISQNKGSSAQALARVGATGYFGGLTRAALAEFQASVGISPAWGNFGPITRAYLKANY